MAAHRVPVVARTTRLSRPAHCAARNYFCRSRPRASCGARKFARHFISFRADELAELRSLARLHFGRRRDFYIDAVLLQFFGIFSGIARENLLNRVSELVFVAIGVEHGLTPSVAVQVTGGERWP